jgi:hypothetical protein
VTPPSAMAMAAAAAAAAPHTSDALSIEGRGLSALCTAINSVGDSFRCVHQLDGHIAFWRYRASLGGTATVARRTAAAPAGGDSDDHQSDPLPRGEGGATSSPGSAWRRGNRTPPDDHTAFTAGLLPAGAEVLFTTRGPQSMEVRQ